MKVNLSRANVYLVDDCDYVVAATAEQACEWSKNEYGEDCGNCADLVDATKKDFFDTETELTDEVMLAYFKMNRGKKLDDHEPLEFAGDAIRLSEQFRFYTNRTLQQELERRVAGKVIFDVPFLLASTEA